jgi:DNA primase
VSFDTRHAAGGARIAPSALTRLVQYGVDSVVFAFDNDAAGRDGVARAIAGASLAKVAPALRVVESRLLGDAKARTALCESTAWRNSASLLMELAVR